MPRKYILFSKEIRLKKSVTQYVTFDEVIKQYLENYSFEIESNPQPKIQFTFISKNGTKVIIPSTNDITPYLSHVSYDQGIHQFDGIELTSESDAIVFLTIEEQQEIPLFY